MSVIARALSQDWWEFLLLGTLSVVLGVLALVWPGKTLAILVLFFGVFVLANGVVQIFAAIGAAGTQQAWGWRFVEGILGVIAELAILRWPGVTALFVLYIVGFWAIITGSIEVVNAIARHEAIPHAWLYALAGCVSVAFGIAMFAWPVGQALVTLVYLLGIYAIVYGILSGVLAFRLRTFPWQLPERYAPPRTLPAS